MTSAVSPGFDAFGLDDAILTALEKIGYSTPSPIQAQTIPLLLEGRDVVGQAQTGTGKTAAFALPILSNIYLEQHPPQVLVLTPTRELAIQVAESFEKYAQHLPGFRSLAIYGGADYGPQLRGLQRGAHVVVGTPGRVMDHIRRSSLELSQLRALVLDEADEMLTMGFIDDVQWILEQTPPERQVALFSATMPAPIRKIANQHLKNPAEVTIKMTSAAGERIRQRFYPVHGSLKLDALSRMLEAEEFDAVLVFVRTKNATVEVSDALEARGYASAALNGDVPQSMRERIVRSVKDSKLDIIVATDVAARGLDVDRLSLVVNYDMPHDVESYVHRIGRTGRAGRNGDAILFVTPRERRMLNSIERTTRQTLERMDLPSTGAINDKRVARFKQRITDALTEPSELLAKIVAEYAEEHDATPLDVAAALAKMAQGNTPLLLSDRPEYQQSSRSRSEAPPPRGRDRERGGRGEREERPRRPAGPARAPSQPEAGMERFRIEVGHDHNVAPGNIVGAVAGESGLDSKNIGRITIYDSHSEVDLPEGMPSDVFHQLREARIYGEKLNISPLNRDLPAVRAKPAKRSDDKSLESKPKPQPESRPRKSAKKPGESSSEGTKPARKAPTAGERKKQSSDEPQKRDRPPLPRSATPGSRPPRKRLSNRDDGATDSESKVKKAKAKHRGKSAGAKTKPARAGGAGPKRPPKGPTGQGKPRGKAKKR